MNDPQWQMQCYGALEADLKAEIEESITFKLAGPLMIAMSMLSDAQEEIERGMQERARQTVNRAKWVIHTYWTAPDALREIHGLATAVVLGTGDALTRLNRIAVLSAP